MRLIFLALALLCVIVCANAVIIDAPKRHSNLQQHSREKREADPANASSDIKLDGGVNRKPSFDYQFRNKLIHKNGLSVNSFGTVNVRPGERPQYLKTFEIEHREKSPARGAVDITLTSDEERQLSANVDVTRTIYEKNGLTIDAAGNVRLTQGQRPQSSVRIDVEKQFPNGYIGGYAEVNRENGSNKPSGGLCCGWKFK